MIRVIYRWRVDQDRRREFVDWWHEGTIRIRSTHHGALGSTLLEPSNDPFHFAAIARWRSTDDLEAFWVEPDVSPFDGAKLVSSEIFEEVDDLTLQGPGTEP
jgi:heme-degrading monooxygenase HmoA